jgi:indolepyruvate ferredoxin oxidoreductase beta subunit
MSTDIVITGVGGQGTLLASRIIGRAAIKQGLAVKAPEVHGISQRGGSVETYVRFSDKPVSSPIIDRGRADIVLAFELLEAYRGVTFLKKGGRIIVNTQEISPMPVITGAAEYPADIVKKLRSFEDIIVETMDANKLAAEAGSLKSVNVVMIGRLAASLAADFSKDVWLGALRETVKPAFIEMNKRAFELGYGGSI